MACLMKSVGKFSRKTKEVLIAEMAELAKSKGLDESEHKKLMELWRKLGRREFDKVNDDKRALFKLAGKLAIDELNEEAERLGLAERFGTGEGGKNTSKKSFYCLTLFISSDTYLHYELNSTQLNSTQLNSTQLNSTQLNSTQLNSTQLNSTQLNSTQLNSTQLNSTQLNSTQLNSTQLNSGCFMRVTQLCFACLSLVVLLSPAQAVLTITIAPDGSGNARMLVVGSGSTTSTTQGSWGGSGFGNGGLFNGNFTTNPFNNFFSGAAARSIYTLNDFEIDGFQVTAGTQTRTLDRFTFEDDGSFQDDFSMGFGDGTTATTWDTDGAGVGTISVLDDGWQTIRFRNTSTFTNPAGEALVFTDNFNVGTYTFSNLNNIFWGGSNTNGITLVISGDVIPEPTSALLLLLPATALLSRKRSC